MNPTDIGTRSEGVILGALLRAGMKVLVPFGGGLRYDLAFDRNGVLLKVQCKTGRYKNGCVLFWTSSADRATRARSHYRDDVDYFAVYCPQIEKVYLVPVDEVPHTQGSLRVTAPKNGQGKGVLWASRYEIEGLFTEQIQGP